MGPCLPRADQTAREKLVGSESRCFHWYSERSTHFFGGGHSVDAKKRESWGQKLLKLGAIVLKFLFL